MGLSLDEASSSPGQVGPIIKTKARVRIEDRQADEKSRYSLPVSLVL